MLPPMPPPDRSDFRLRAFNTFSRLKPEFRFGDIRRMLRAIREIVSGANLTNAAHAAGYADQAHFAREFRRTFGASASAGIIDARG
jgi:AraC-like DNA-binding protein